MCHLGATILVEGFYSLKNALTVALFYDACYNIFDPLVNVHVKFSYENSFKFDIYATILNNSS